MIRAGLMVVAIFVPLQIIPPELVTQGTQGIIIFFAVALAQGILILLQRWKPASGSNGDVVQALKAVEATSLASVSAYAEFTRTLTDQRLEDERAAAERHLDLMLAIKERKSA